MLYEIRRCLVEVSAVTLASLMEAFCGISQPLQVNARVVLPLGKFVHLQMLPVHYSLKFLPLDAT